MRLGQSFANLESLVEVFGAAQKTQVKMQSRLYEQIDQMQDNIFVARALLADVSSSASNLQTTIEDTSTRMAQMTSTFSGMAENIFRWTWPLLLVAFLIHQFCPKYNPLAMSALGKVLSFFLLLLLPKCFQIFMAVASFQLSLS